MKIRYYSHASFQIVGCFGTRMLMDPWLHNPIYGNMVWQFPECPVSGDDYIKQDILYISHDHPDHFCPKTLSIFDRNTKIIIRRYGKLNPIKPILMDMGFTNIIELNHRETYVFHELKITLFCNYSTTDSAILISDDKNTVFNQNDCMLSDEEAKFIGKNFSIDIALIFYSSASIYPTFFDMPEPLKHIETLKRNEVVLERAAKYAHYLNVSKVIPCAGDCVYFRLPETDFFAGPLPIDFKNFVDSKGYKIEVITPPVGEIIDLENLDNQQFLPNFSSRSEWLESLNQLRRRKDVYKTTNYIIQWEESFKYIPDIFYSLFSDYCCYVNQYFDDTFQDINLKNGEIIVVFIVENYISNFEYCIQIDFQNKTSNFQELINIKQTEQNIHMQLSIKSKYLAMVSERALSFDDLKAGYFLIKRKGKFSKLEEAFWHFLSNFSSYISIEKRIYAKKQQVFSGTNTNILHEHLS
ncbi:MAG: MBL fold metallo-hydrolase [Calothrix sp. MO_192.B10]|nr:MBL fold metallo-hydrolase [Calothrix sp. MO_192.B10]